MTVEIETQKRWRQHALQSQLAFALDRPLPSEAEIRVTVTTLAIYIQCLTVEIQGKEGASE